VSKQSLYHGCAASDVARATAAGLGWVVVVTAGGTRVGGPGAAHGRAHRLGPLS